MFNENKKRMGQQNSKKPHIEKQIKRTLIDSPIKEVKLIIAEDDIIIKVWKK